MRQRLAGQFPIVQRAIAVLWPSFAMAIIASGLFFSAFDPVYLYPFNLDMEFSPLAAYTLGFFAFWLLTALSSFGTLYFIVSYQRLRDYFGD